MNIIETERLILREFTIEDDQFILELLNSPGWLRFIGDRGVRNLNDASNYLQSRIIGSYELNGFGLWMMVVKETNTAVGLCGLIKRDGLDDVDIGFALLPGFEGNGYAWEAASAT